MIIQVSIALKKIFFVFFSLYALNCGIDTKTDERALLQQKLEAVIDERALLQQKLEAFQFLSAYHHQLHVMIGEENGDIKKAYYDFNDAINEFDSFELLAIKNAFSGIRPDQLSPSSESVKRLDYLVDYYQSGLSMQIEAIFRGYGQLQMLDFNNAMSLYDDIKK